MAKLLRLTIADEVFHADLLEDEAPRTCAQIEQMGAVETALFSANICYGEFTFSLPLPSFDLEENIQPDTHIGQIAWYPGWECVCVFMQKMKQFGPTAQFAQVRDEDIPAFQDLAARLWHHQGIPVRVEVVDSVEAPSTAAACGWTGFNRDGLPSEAQGFMDTLDASMEQIWTAPPSFEALRNRNAETGRELSAWAYTWGELIALGDALMPVGALAKQGRGDAATLGLAAAAQCREFAGLLSSSSAMDLFGEVLGGAAEAFELVQTHEALLCLCRVMQLWTSQLAFWLSAELPASASAAVHAAWNPELPDPNLA